MKKNDISIVFVSAALAVLAGCSAGTAIPDTEKDDALTFTASVVSEDRPQTPTKVGYGVTASGLKLSWEKDDCIGIWSSNADGILRSNSRYKAESSEAASAFSYVVRSERLRWASETGKQSFYACWPYNEESGTDPHSVPVSIPAVQAQESNNVTGHLDGVDFMWTASENLSKADGTDVTFGFHHAFSVLDLEVTNDKRMFVGEIILRCTSNPNAPVSFTGATIDLATGKVDLSKAVTSSEIRLQCGFATSYPASSHFYLVFNPALGGETIRVLAKIGENELLLAEKKVPDEGLPVGKTINLKANVTVPDEAAIQIKDLSGLGTANTYIVTNGSDFYRFKATVKGNGNIPSALSALEGGETIEPKSALILWYNTVQTNNSWVNASPVVISSVSLLDGYIYFDTPKKFVPGNVVIAAFAEEGVTCDNIEVDENYGITNATLLWSWNIWAAEDYNPDDSPLTAGGRKMMDRNLGAALSGTGTTGMYEPAAALGNVYQWGRKDPYPNFVGYTNASFPCIYFDYLFALPSWTPVKALGLQKQGAQEVDGLIFGYRHKADGAMDTDNAYTMVQRSEITTEASAGNDVFLGYAKTHPHKFISGKPVASTDYSGDYTWFNPKKDNSWNSLWGSDKTVYDPCPVGWRVWTMAEAEDFLTVFVAGDAQLDANQYGYDYKGCYFPFAGRGRDSQNGRVNYVAATGYPTESNFWCADSCPYIGVWGKKLRFSAPANYVNAEDKTPKYAADTGHPAAGYSIRCVREQ